MPTITGTLNFTVGNQTPVATTTTDIKPAAIVAVSSGNSAITQTSELRRLVYPTNDFAPLIYESNPDLYTNFNTSPLDKRPRAFAQATLQDNILIGWQGVSRDVNIDERWVGSARQSRMTLAMFLALNDYYSNPPTNGSYIIWEPRDRTSKTYEIVIENLTLSMSGSAGQGAGDYEFDYLVTRHGYVSGTVQLSFRIVGEV
jgi:hypothetical protein